MQADLNWLTDPTVFQVNRLDATLTLTASEGTVAEVVPYDTGFRRFELKNGLMLLNGERTLKFCSPTWRAGRCPVNVRA